MIVAVSIIGAYLFVSTNKDRKTADVPSKPTTPTTSIYTPPVEVFSTQYFQFQGNKHWTFIASESTPNKFLYRYLRDTLIEHELAIYINPIGNLPDSTRVLPVTIKSNNSLAAENVSEMCKSAKNLKNITSIHQFQLFGVEFTCNPDSIAYTVAVGKKDGKSPFVLTRSDGTSALYGMIYKNLTAKPNGREIVDLMNSFQSR